MKRLSPLALCVWAAFGATASAETITVAPVAVTDMKALFGSVQSGFVIPARTRIGGTLVTLDVTEGSAVKAGQVIARVVDDKLELQLAAADARISSAGAQLTNAEAELARNAALLKRGATTAQQLDQVRTTVDVVRNAKAEAEAARSVLVQQMQEGDVIAPGDGRVLTLPMQAGQFVLPGETVAMVAGGGVSLRLAIPERHAGGLQIGATVSVGDGQTGRIAKIYPDIVNGRVTADATVEGLADDFIGKRILVMVPVASREALAVPEAAISTRSGIDMVEIEEASGSHAIVVVPGDLVATPAGPMREILSGLRAGDTVIVP